MTNPKSCGLGFRGTQRAQYLLIKEYSLNHSKDPFIFQGMFLNWEYWGSLGSYLIRTPKPTFVVEKELHRSLWGIPYD